METTPSLILSRGRGSRLGPRTCTFATPPSPIDAGVRDVSVAIGPATGNEIRNALWDRARSGARFTHPVPQAQTIQWDADHRA